MNVGQRFLMINEGAALQLLAMGLKFDEVSMFGQRRPDISLSPLCLCGRAQQILCALCLCGGFL